MLYKKNNFSKLLALLLSLSFLTSSKIAHATLGGMGAIMGGILVLLGAKDVHLGMGETNTWCTCAANPYSAASCQPGCTKGRWQIAQGIGEIAGGAASMLMNSENDKQTSPGGGLNFDKTTTGGLNLNLPKNPDGTTPNLPDKCKEIPQICKCNDASCNQPTLQLPPKEELEASIKGGPKVNPSDTSTLEDALAKLNENYDKAKQGVDAFNRLSAGGAFDPSGSGSTLALDDSGGAGGGDYVGLNKDGSDAGSKGGAGGGGFDFSPNPLANNADLDNLKKMRGEPDPVTNVGMNLRNNNTNKLLTIFERAARVLRGDRNRDISLAKIEWTRKEAAKKQGKGPASMPAPKQ